MLVLSKKLSTCVKEIPDFVIWSGSAIDITTAYHI